MTPPSTTAIRIPRADEPLRPLRPLRSLGTRGAGPLRSVRAARGVIGRLPSACGATGISVVVHGVALLVAILAFAAPPPFDSTGSALQVALAPYLGDEAESEEDYAEALPPIEPLEVEEILEPVIAEATPLEERPLEDDEELEALDPFAVPAKVPELSVAVVGVRLPRRKAPTPPVAPARIVSARVVPASAAPRQASPAPRRPAPVRAPRAGRRGGATGTGRLVPVHRPHHFPSHARRLGISGTARVEMLVAPGGNVVRVRLVTSSGHAALDEAALASARQWRYRPPGEYRRARQSFSFHIG